MVFHVWNILLVEELFLVSKMAIIKPVTSGLLKCRFLVYRNWTRHSRSLVASRKGYQLFKIWLVQTTRANTVTNQSECFVFLANQLQSRDQSRVNWRDLYCAYDTFDASASSLLLIGLLLFIARRFNISKCRHSKCTLGSKLEKYY